MATGKNRSARAARHPWTRGEKWLLAGIIALCALIYGSWKILIQAPPLAIPQVAAPNPNGFDLFVKAGAFAPSQWRPWAIRPKTSAPDMSRKTWLTAPPTAQQLATIAHAPAADAFAVALLRQGLRAQTLAPQYRQLEQAHPEWVNLRSLARAVSATAYVQAARGQDRTSLQTALDGLDMSAQISHGASMLHETYSVFCASDCRRPIWSLVDRLDSASARGAALRIAAIDSHTDSFSQILTHEKWAGQASLTASDSDPRWRVRTLLSASATRSERSDAITNPATELRAYTRDMDLAIAAVHGPYSRAALPSHSGVAWADLSAGLDCDFLLDSWCAWCLKAADNRLLAATLALRAYRLEHGRYPATLQALTPRYLPAVPGDPFSPAPLLYRSQCKGYVLYSIGPDGKDDGGTPAFDKRNRDMPYLVGKSSQGDIVAGINE
jgi:hypothetical protein